MGPKIVSANRWESETKRISEIESKNKIYFLEAFNDKNKEFKFRQRNTKMEIQKDMKYTPKNTLEKVANTLIDTLMILD